MTRSNGACGYREVWSATRPSHPGFRLVRIEEILMRILITGSGTRGDVQPSAALADALVRAGHATTLAVPTGFDDAESTPEVR